jgi:hypothetical protein
MTTIPKKRSKPQNPKLTRELGPMAAIFVKMFALGIDFPNPIKSLDLNPVK